MANPVALQKINGKYLWYSLLSLGFQPETATLNLVGKTNVKYINLGINMFDKPNKDAFHIVIHFLLDKLNPTRFHEAYRHCWPVLSQKADAEFRKITCAWLKDIMDENKSSGLKVVASLFLLPGGPKFIALMLNLASHVMLQEMKTFGTDGQWAPEAAATPASSLDIAMKRFKLTKRRFVKSAVQQDHLLQEYQRRAQSLVKSIQEIRADGAKYDNLLKHQEDGVAKEGAPPAEKLKKVRALWSAIDEMLSKVKEEQRVVESVLKGEPDQHSLDGTNMGLKLPRLLLEKIERLPQHLSTGNLYEAGQLNPLCMLELMNHALELLKEERSRVAGHAALAELQPQDLQKKSGQITRVLEDLRILREKIFKEEIPEVRNSTRKLEVEWDRKWLETLEHKPLASFLSDDPVLCFLSPMAPLSFEPAAEAPCSSSVFSLYPAKLLEEKPTEIKSQEGIDTIYPEINRNTVSSTTTVEMAESPAAATLFRANTSLWDLFDTPSPPARAPSPTPLPPAHQVSEKVTLAGSKLTKNKAMILDWECENLANQFAEAVTMTSPVDGKLGSLDLGDLLCNLGGDPFSTKKQLPRTPESLILDVKSSWRKAVEESQAQTPQLAKLEGDGISVRVTPCPASQESLTSPFTCSSDADPRSPTQATATCPGSLPAHHQRAAPVSPQAWDSPGMEAPRVLSGAGSSAVPFSINDETLPNLPGSDSLLSLSDEATDASDGSNDCSLPRHHVPVVEQKSPSRWCLDGDEASFLDNGKGTLEWPPESPQERPGSDGDWLVAGAGLSVSASDKLFTLDLETLDSPSPPREVYTLPKLITFPPIDDV